MPNLTFTAALAEARKVGTARCSDPALMAAIIKDVFPVIVGAIAPELLWNGAQKMGMTTKQLVNLAHDEPIEAAELMWVE